MPDRACFDAPGFYAALDAERARRAVTWRQVALEAGVSQSTLTRLSQGKRPGLDGFAVDALDLLASDDDSS